MTSTPSNGAADADGREIFTITPEPLTPEAFAPFGTIIGVREEYRLPINNYSGLQSYRPGPLLAETRMGRMSLGGNQIEIVPIHNSHGLKIPTSDPLGYRFLSGGRVIGAVDLNGQRKTIYVSRTSPDERQAVLIGSLALSVLWKA